MYKRQPNINKPLESVSYYLTPFGEGTQEQLKLDGVNEGTLDSDLDKLYNLPGLNCCLLYTSRCV